MRISNYFNISYLEEFSFLVDSIPPGMSGTKLNLMGPDSLEQFGPKCG